MRVFVAGATGYIGRHAVHALLARGHEVVAFARPRAGVGGRADEAETRRRLEGAEVRFGDVTEPASLAQDGFRGEPFDAVMSCLATRTGGVEDAWRIERDANRNVLEAAKAAGATRFVLLSAICVQKPKLAFQHAKLAFEQDLMQSGLTYSIVRPTAFFKSLGGQIESVRRGKPFVMFGDGVAPECKPISEVDLARFLAECLEDPARENQVLPVGGPGPVITPRMQGELLARAMGHEPRYRRVPLWVFDGIIGLLSALGLVYRPLRDKAEFARIGRYYASESMLVWDEARGAYDPDATPSYGTETLADFYARAADAPLADQELGDHTLFAKRREDP